MVSPPLQNMRIVKKKIILDRIIFFYMALECVMFENNYLSTEENKINKRFKKNYKFYTLKLYFNILNYNALFVGILYYGL